MKLFKHGAETPSLANWLAFFFIGFIVFTVLGMIICGMLWLGSMAEPSDALLGGFSPSYSLSIVLIVSFAFGIYLATALTRKTRELQRTKKARAVRIPGHHPLLGDFEHAPYFNSWAARPPVPSGGSIALGGRGSAPSEAELALWQGFSARYDELVRLATEALVAKAANGGRDPRPTLTPNSISLDGQGRLEILFDITEMPKDFRPADYEEYCPIAVFSSNLSLERVTW